MRSETQPDCAQFRLEQFVMRQGGQLVGPVFLCVLFTIAVRRDAVLQGSGRNSVTAGRELTTWVSAEVQRLFEVIRCCK